MKLCSGYLNGILCTVQFIAGLLFPLLHRAFRYNLFIWVWGTTISKAVYVNNSHHLCIILCSLPKLLFQHLFTCRIATWNQQGMDLFRLPALEIPRFLFRVQYEECQVSENMGGLWAGDIDTFYSNNELALFRQSVIRHFNWSWRGPQPYITLFSNLHQAENWALGEPWNTEGNRKPWNSSGTATSHWQIVIIDTQRLIAPFFFRLKHLNESFNLGLSDSADLHVDGTYLSLHRVVGSAIVGRKPASQVKEGKVQAFRTYKASTTLLTANRKGNFLLT